MTWHIVVLLEKLAFYRSQIQIQPLKQVLFEIYQLLKLHSVKHIVKGVSYLVLYFERYVFVEIFISGC
jgi:hypothetical protein